MCVSAVVVLTKIERNCHLQWCFPVKRKNRQKSFSKASNPCLFMNQMQQRKLNVALFVLTPAGCAGCFCLSFLLAVIRRKNEDSFCWIPCVWGCFCLCFDQTSCELCTSVFVFIGCHVRWSFRLCYCWMLDVLFDIFL